jgi:hypothetical protein
VGSKSTGCRAPNKNGSLGIKDNRVTKVISQCNSTAEIELGNSTDVETFFGQTACCEGEVRGRCRTGNHLAKGDESWSKFAKNTEPFLAETSLEAEEALRDSATVERTGTL